MVKEAKLRTGSPDRVVKTADAKPARVVQTVETKRVETKLEGLGIASRALRMGSAIPRVAMAGIAGDKYSARTIRAILAFKGGR